MVRDRTAYERALQTGAARVEEKRWDEAITAYQTALAEFPDDPDALNGLGLALCGARDLEAALQTLQRAAEVAPDSVKTHVNLLRVYLAQRKTADASREYLTLANIYHSRGQTQQALDICQHALKADPRNADLLALADRLRKAGQAETPVLDFFSDQTREPDEEGGPVETARQRALADLAEGIFGEAPPKTGPLVLRPLSKREVDGLISKALDAQTRGDTEGAIASYEKVLGAGVIQPAVNFNLGLLYQQKLRFEDAITQFQRSVDEQEYRLGSLFALGECYRALGRIDEALTHFIDVLRIVDLGTVQRAQADDVIQLYEELAHTHAAKGEGDQAVEFVNTLISFLSKRGWEDKVAEARERLDTLASEGPVLSLAEILSVPGSERILQSISLAQEFQRRGLWYAALDELNRAIGLAPTFLPLHRQMGETLLQMDRVSQAVAKFLAIADTYRVRGSFSQAMAMYERALRLTPMDVTVRAKLIDLLVSHGYIDRALEHYMTLGDTYCQMAELDRAREKFDEALQLAPRGSPQRNWTVRLLHRIGDIAMQRVDWRRAASVYEQIRDLSPDDEKARLTLMDLYYRFDQPEMALRELNGLLHHYRQAGKMQKVITILDERVQERSDDISLRAWLAQAYLDTGNVAEALQQLDTLGDLQLQAGRTEDAIVTVKAILRLNPPNADAYVRLLQQLSAGKAPDQAP